MLMPSGNCYQRKKAEAEEKSVGKRKSKATTIEFVTSSRNLAAIKRLWTNQSEGDRTKLIRELLGEEHMIYTAIMSSLKEVVHERRSSDRAHEEVRSTIISACCGPDVDLLLLCFLRSLCEV